MSRQTMQLSMHRRLWEVKILEALNRGTDQKGRYVLLRSQQVRTDSPKALESNSSPIL